MVAAAVPGQASDSQVTRAALDEDRSMATFIIHTHGRLQEWIADERGYFRDEGLDYEFKHGLTMESAKRIDGSGEVDELHPRPFHCND